jgi:hypothetical protein
MLIDLTENKTNDQFVYPGPEGSELIVLAPFRVRGYQGWSIRGSGDLTDEHIPFPNLNQKLCKHEKNSLKTSRC